MPALPAYVILFAAIPLLVPTLPRRLGTRIAALPGRRRGAGRGRCIVLLAIVPAAFILAASPSRGGDKAIELNGLLVPVDGETITLPRRASGLRST